MAFEYNDIEVSILVALACYLDRGDFMATKSFLKVVRIDNRGMVKSLVSALENAEKKSAKGVVLTRPLEEVKGECIKLFFGEKNDRV